MNELDIFCFTSVARTGSISITARELMISQQAVSKRIKCLEEEIGYQLFFRDSGPLVLTKAGTYMFEYFHERNKLDEEIQNKFRKAVNNTRFIIACSQWIGTPAWFINAVQKFQSVHPDLDIHLLNLDAVEAIKVSYENGANFLLTSRYMTRYLNQAWKFTNLLKQPLYIIRSIRPSISGEQLGLYPFFAPYAGEQKEEQIRMRVINTCRKLGFVPQNIISCNDMGTVFFNVLLNYGITLGAYADEYVDTHEIFFEKTKEFIDIVICTPEAELNALTTEFKMLLDNSINLVRKGGLCE